MFNTHDISRNECMLVRGQGKCYEFNFSKFWSFTRTKFECKETDT